jgi:mono/diheme cytochrome c family protein
MDSSVTPPGLARWIAGATLLASACSGAGTGPAGANVQNAQDEHDVARVLDAAPPTADDGADCLSARIAAMEPELDVCRSCHVQHGLAESTHFLLDDAVHDEERLLAAFGALGQKLVAKPSQEGGLLHGGGQLLKPDTPAYAAWSSLIAALSDPTAACGMAAVPPPPDSLLGSSHGGHLWSRFCEGKADSAELPVDPRTRVLPGTNEGLAVHFNAHWTDCDGKAPRTCGEYRAGYARGKDVMVNGKMWFFGGDETDAMLTILASTYNDMWREWGLRERPANYDELVAERWGIPLASERNPYPLPGEDPEQTHGGSGQLPLALTQVRDKEGKWQGKLSFNCHWCHSSKVGDAAEGKGLGNLYGSGNPLLDVTAGFGKFGYGITGLIPLAANKTRGTGDILLYPAIAALDLDRAQHYNESILAAPSQGSVDYPTWWNVGHRTRRFHDGSFAMDDARPVMGFFMPIFRWTSVLDITAGRAWIEERAQDVQLWLEALTSPEFPGPIDTSLAQAGAVLFHTKDLWAPELNNPVARPAGGNGSCASCHGAYSPRYVNDPAFLERPELEGIASFIVPLTVIGTDPARSDSLTDRLAETLDYSWWGYGEPDAKGACFGAPDIRGYLAPPLYGIWASSPYFHNASVPNLWQVLSPKDRPEIWQRVSTPRPANQPNAFMGYDANLARAYDFDKLGFRYDVLSCSTSDPALDCTDVTSEESDAAKALLSGGASAAWFAWNIAPQPSDNATLEKRKIYNTHKYSQSNRGHEFTAVLSDAERLALLEYLKTL